MSLLKIKGLDEGFSVCGQVTVGDLKLIASAGYETLINNRPDGEDCDQPKSDALKLAAEAMGLTYIYIPVAGADFSMDKVSAVLEALQSAPKPTLAFCRTGNRSANLWARAMARCEDADIDQIVQYAARAGYDLSIWAKDQRPRVDDV